MPEILPRIATGTDTRPRGRWLRGLARLAGAWGIVAFAAGALAQEDLPPRDLFRDRLQREGNQISVCYNPDGMMAEFELDLARAIGDALLIRVRPVPIPSRMGIATPPFDYRAPMLPDQLYVLLAQSCSGYLGFSLSPNLPEWLMVTRPYMVAPMVLVVADPDYGRLQDVPLDRPIGTRSMSSADNRLINYLQARPEAQRWRRFPYFSNDVVLERLADGTIGIGLVWEPALYYITEGNPGAAGYHILPEMPFSADPIEIGIATRIVDRYLNELLGGAIAALVEDGTVDALLQAHNMRPASGL